MKAAIYIRVSTQLQATDRQRTELTEYANSHGYTITEVYEDQMSGFSNDRPSYNRLKEDAKKGLFDIVLFSEMSRMTRKNILLTEVDYFKDLNIQVFFQKQNILVTNAPNDLGTTILLSVLSAISGYEVALMKERTISGKLENSRKQPIRNGRSAYGYDAIKGRIIVSHPESDHVVEALTKYASGWHIADLCTHMRQVTNRSWNATTISKIIRNPLYRGHYIVTYSGQTIEQYYPELRIISEELYDAVIHRQSINKRASKRKDTAPVRDPFILNDLIFCPHCGRTIRGKSMMKSQMYLCAGKNEAHRQSGNMCTIRCSWNSKNLEALVWDVIKGASVTRNNEVNTKEQLTTIASLIQDLHHQLKISETQLSGLDNELNNYIKKAVRYNLPDSAIDEFNSEIQRKKRDLNSNIESMKSRLKSSEKQQAFLLQSGDETSIKALLDEAENDIQLKKKYIHDFVDRIVIQSIERTNYMTIKTKDGNGWIITWAKYQKGLPKYTMAPYINCEGYVLPESGNDKPITRLSKEDLIKMSKSIRQFIDGGK